MAATDVPESTDVQTLKAKVTELESYRTLVETQAHGTHPLLPSVIQAYEHTPRRMHRARAVYAARIIEMGGEIPSTLTTFSKRVIPRIEQAWDGWLSNVTFVIICLAVVGGLIFGGFAGIGKINDTAGQEHAREVTGLQAAIWQAENVWKRKHGSYTDNIDALKMGQSKPVYQLLNDYDRKGAASSRSGDAFVIVDPDGKGYRTVVRESSSEDSDDEPLKSAEIPGMRWREGSNNARGCQTKWKFKGVPCNKSVFSLDQAMTLVN